MCGQAQGIKLVFTTAANERDRRINLSHDGFELASLFANSCDMDNMGLTELRACKSRIESFLAQTESASHFRNVVSSTIIATRC